MQEKLSGFRISLPKNNYGLPRNIEAIELPFPVIKLLNVSNLPKINFKHIDLQSQDL